jgi:uncharacterized protein YkwD
MNGKLIVAVFVVFVLGYVLSRSPDPTPDVMANDYATTIATVATIAAYESLSPPKEVVQYPVEDSVVNEVVQEVAEQMEALSESSEPVTIPVSQTIETEIVPVSQVVATEVPLVDEPVMDELEQGAWDALNRYRVSQKKAPLKYNAAYLEGCRKHARDQEKRNSLWHARNRQGCGENCAVSGGKSNVPPQERPIRQWIRSTDHRIFMESNVTEGAIGRSGVYWVFRAKTVLPTKTVTIEETTGNPQYKGGSVIQGNFSISNPRTGNSLDTTYSDDGASVKKTYKRTGRHRPLRYALWRTFS